MNKAVATPLTPTRHAALLLIAQDVVAHQRHTIAGVKPHYTVNGVPVIKNAPFDFLTSSGFACHDGDDISGTPIHITDMGADYFRF